MRTHRGRDSRPGASSRASAFPTWVLPENIVNREPGKVHGIRFMNRIITFPDGLRIVADGKLIGAVGATDDQDEECAQAGPDAAEDKLK